MEKLSYLKNANAAFIEDLLERFQADPESVDPTWRYFFEGLELGTEAGVATGEGPVPATTGAGVDLSAEAKVAELINAYRELGRLIADLDPLGKPGETHPLLELSRFGLQPSDLDRTFTAGKLVGLGAATLRQILAFLRETYCSTVGVEFTHIHDVEEREWVRQRVEATRNHAPIDAETRKFILRRLTESESFERFLHTRYVAQKRFSVEGGEALIPCLDCMIEEGAELGAREFVMGMAHRGRLNVLANIFGKKPEDIFSEFEGTYVMDTATGEGDVKYHKGYSAEFTTRHGKPLHLSLAANPSHLEHVNPVIEGIARAKQAQLRDAERRAVLPIAVHGDAAFAGQGLCYETLNLSQLNGYRTGGTLHVVINNQIGFTATPDESRSTTYATDLAKMLEVPIFHVNGDDPEAVWNITRLCAEYRQKFNKDVFIDIICYRKHGHNEGDEPSFTQPGMYKKVKAHPSPREVYARKLVQAGVLTEAEAKGMVDAEMTRLTQAQSRARAGAEHSGGSAFDSRWKGFHAAQATEVLAPIDSDVPEARLRELSEKLNRMPEGFHLHSKLTRFFEARARAVRDGVGIDWGNAEALAYGTLLLDGYGVRLSGQDVERGTFTHRHAVLIDTETDQAYVPLNHLAEGQPPFQVHNSHLSEAGVLGFEFGYSLAEPRTLVLWEAQFGDFANGAQAIIDQFIASAESKWQRSSGIVLLLPHGFEGQGPEHSSARLERFLQLCGRSNLVVANFTTPAQFFHALRRQMLWKFRKPLVVMTPKSLLRHPQAVSELRELSTGGFREVLDDPTMLGHKAQDARRVILCSGKVYYDLLLERADRRRDDVALVRVEQLYPWPERLLASILRRYPKADLVWAQEEPRNMGAWTYVFSLWNGGTGDFRAKAGDRGLRYAGREIGAAPAVGSAKLHEKEQSALLEQAFSD